MARLQALFFILWFWLLCTAAFGDEISEKVVEVSGTSVQWLVPSPDGSKVAVAVKGKNGTTVYLDKEAVGTYDDAIVPIFSSNSKSFAFLGIKSQKAFFVVNGKKLRDTNISPQSLTNLGALSFSISTGVAFSKDGSRFAYRDSVSMPGFQTGRVFTSINSAIFVNDVQEAEHMEVGSPVFNPITNVVNYRVVDASTKGIIKVGPDGPETEMTGYVKTTSTAPTKYLTTTDPIFSFDGSKLVFGAEKPVDKWVISVNNKEGSETYKFISAVTISKKNKIAFVTGLPGIEQTAIIDATPDKKNYKAIPWIFFSDDGEKYGYTGYSDSGYILVVNGVENFIEKEGQLYGPFFTPLNDYTYITVSGARSFVCAKGKKYGPYATVFPIQYSADEKHSAFLAMDGITRKYKMIIDGQDNQSYDVLTLPVFLTNDKLQYYGVNQNYSNIIVYSIKIKL